jgi:hypothetical protein
MSSNYFDDQGPGVATASELEEDLLKRLSDSGATEFVEVGLNFLEAYQGRCTLDRIWVRPANRRGGLANIAMRVITDFLDQHRLTADLVVKPLDEGFQADGLENWYTKFGFTPAGHSDAGSVKMIRMLTTSEA